MNSRRRLATIIHAAAFAALAVIACAMPLRADYYYGNRLFGTLYNQALAYDPLLVVRHSFDFKYTLDNVTKGGNVRGIRLYLENGGTMTGDNPVVTIRNDSSGSPDMTVALATATVAVGSTTNQWYPTSGAGYAVFSPAIQLDNNGGAGKSYHIVIERPVGGSARPTWNIVNEMGFDGNDDQPDDADRQSYYYNTTDWVATDNSHPLFVLYFDTGTMGDTYNQLTTDVHTQITGNSVLSYYRHPGMRFDVGEGNNRTVNEISAVVRKYNPSTAVLGNVDYHIYKDDFSFSNLITSGTLVINADAANSLWTRKTVQVTDKYTGLSKGVKLDDASKYYIVLFCSVNTSYSDASYWQLGAMQTVPAGLLNDNTAGGQIFCAGYDPYGSTAWTSYVDSDHSLFFNVDQTTPAALVAYPLNNAGYNLGNLGVISGTCADVPAVADGPVSGIKTMQVSLKDQGGFFWNGTDFIDNAGVDLPLNVTLSPATTAWWYTGISVSDFLNYDTQRYTLRRYVVDDADLTPSWGGDVQFWFDKDKPSSVVSSPDGVQMWYSPASIATIRGTAKDPGCGLNANSARVSAKRISDDMYWGGGSWLAGYRDRATVHSAAINNQIVTWTYDTTNATGDGLDWGVSGSSFVVSCKVSDKSGLAGDLSVGNTFWWDQTAPTAAVISPQDITLGDAGLAKSNQNLAAYGQYFDRHSGLDGSNGSLEYRLYNKTQGEYYKSGAWSAGTEPAIWPSNLTDTNLKIWQSSWTLSLTGALRAATGVNEGDDILLVIRAKDKSGNLQTDFTEGFSSNTFKVDRTNPDSSITIPATQWRSKLQTISGTAADTGAVTSKITQADLAIYYKSGADYYYWNGTAFGLNVSSWNPCDVSALPDVTYNTSAISWQENVKYYLSIRSKDAAGNIQAKTDPPDDVSYDSYYYYDVSFPTATITSHTNGSYYNSVTQIAGQANDSPTPPAGNLTVSNVKMYIRKVGTPPEYYWNKTTALWDNTISPDDGSAWFQVSGNPVLPDWKYDTTSVAWSTGPAGAWDGGGTFEVKVRAQDSAASATQSGNYQNYLITGGSSITFTVDTLRPVAAVTRFDAAGRSVSTVN